MSIRSLLLFIRDNARVKSIGSREGHRSGDPSFFVLKICWLIVHACVQE
jgi:hypothetical protein